MTHKTMKKKYKKQPSHNKTKYNCIKNILENLTYLNENDLLFNDLYYEDVKYNAEYLNYLINKT